MEKKKTKRYILTNEEKKVTYKPKPYDVLKQKFPHIRYKFKSIKGKKHITLYSYISSSKEGSEKRLFEKVKFSNKRKDKIQEYKQRTILTGTFFKNTKVEVFNEKAKETKSIFFFKESKYKSNVTPYKQIHKKVVRNEGEVQQVGYYQVMVNGYKYPKIYKGVSSKKKAISKKGKTKQEEIKGAVSAQATKDGIPYENRTFILIKSGYNAYL